MPARMAATSVSGQPRMDGSSRGGTKGPVRERRATRRRPDRAGRDSDGPGPGRLVAAGQIEGRRQGPVEGHRGLSLGPGGDRSAVARREEARPQTDGRRGGGARAGRREPPEGHTQARERLAVRAGEGGHRLGDVAATDGTQRLGQDEDETADDSRGRGLAEREEGPELVTDDDLDPAGEATADALAERGIEQLRRQHLHLGRQGGVAGGEAGHRLPAPLRLSAGADPERLVPVVLQGRHALAHELAERAVGRGQESPRAVSRRGVGHEPEALQHPRSQPLDEHLAVRGHAGHELRRVVPGDHRPRAVDELLSEALVQRVGQTVLDLPGPRLPGAASASHPGRWET